MMKRRSNREGRPRDRERKKAPGNFEEKERTPSPVKYGMDAETEDRVWNLIRFLFFPDSSFISLSHF
jgi:hypothetical protein